MVVNEFVIPRHIRLVVFDLDGTLVAHNYAFWCREAVRIYPLLGAKSVTWAKARRDFGSNDFFAALPFRNRERLISRFWELYDVERSPFPHCLPRIRTTLKQLKGFGLMIGVATARMESSSSLILKLRRWKLRAYVDFIVAGADFQGASCPSKVPMLLQLLQLAGVSGQEAMMVGDDPSDIESARAAGYATQVAVCTGGIDPAVLASANPTLLVNDASSLHCSDRIPRRECRNKISDE